MRPFVFLAALACATPLSADTLRVFAAASLKEAFEELAAQYQRDNPGDRVELNFAGSQALARQIEQGAAADVFASADQAHMDALVEGGFAGGGAVFARNRLALAAAKDGPVAALADAARPGVKVVMADASVPAGRYTEEALDKMAKDPAFGAGFSAGVRANAVSREASVRSVLMKVSLGEADAGFVYETDAAAAGGAARVVALPEGVNVTAEYPIAVLRGSAAPEKARAFVALVLGGKGRAILKRRGFRPGP